MLGKCKVRVCFEQRDHNPGEIKMIEAWVKLEIDLKDKGAS
jgi:hypothetical protein